MFGRSHSPIAWMVHGSCIHLQCPSDVCLWKVWTKACAQHLYKSLKGYTEKYGPSIMANPDRNLTNFAERDRQVITENDLEQNFSLLKTLAASCFEYTLHHVGHVRGVVKEIPNLAEFEAG